MIILLTIFSILIPILIGTMVVNFIGLYSGKKILFKSSLGFGIGAGIIYYQMYFYSRLGIKWSTLEILFPWIVFISIYLLKFKPRFPIFKFKKINKIEFFLLTGILVSFSYTLFEALIRPLYTWDGWANWILKSNVFFLDKQITTENLRYIGTDTPLLISALGSFIYINLGKIDDTQVLILSTAYYVFLNILFFSVLRERFNLKMALIFTLFLSTTQALVRQGGRFEAGQADLPLAYYFFCSAIILFDYLKNRNIKLLGLLVFILSLVIFTKLDGIAFVLIVNLFIIVDIYKSKLYSHALLSFVWILPFIEWQMFKSSTGLNNIYFGEHGHKIIFSFSKIFNALRGSVTELINIKTWSILWLMYFFTFLLKTVRKNKELIILNLLIISQLILYLFLYFFTFGNDPESSAQRLLVHLAPLALFEIALTYKLIIK